MSASVVHIFPSGKSKTFLQHGHKKVGQSTEQSGNNVAQLFCAPNERVLNLGQIHLCVPTERDITIECHGAATRNHERARGINTDWSIQLEPRTVSRVLTSATLTYLPTYQQTVDLTNPSKHYRVTNRESDRWLFGVTSPQSSSLPQSSPCTEERCCGATGLQ